MDILYFCPHRIIPPPKGKPGFSSGKPKGNWGFSSGNRPPENNFSIRSISKHETTDSL